LKLFQDDTRFALCGKRAYHVCGNTEQYLENRLEAPCVL
jgi:hypothetical protein